MTRKDLRQRAERLLQDQENKRWSDSELNGYIDDAQTEFCRIAKIPKTSSTQNLVDVSTRRTGASLAISSKTVTVTLDGSDTHTLQENDSVLISGSSSATRNGGHIVATAPTTSTFTYTLDAAESGSDSDITIVETGPVYSKPSTIMEITNVSLDGRDLAIYTESDLDKAANRNISKGYYLKTNLGLAPSPFYALNSAYTVPKWRDEEGTIESVVFNERSATSFRVFPLPSETDDIYVDKDADTKVSQRIIIRGVTNPSALSSDTSSSVIPDSYQEALVYGALERAYLKESQLRNVDKAQLYKAKFMELTAEALRNEGLNSSSLGMGRNSGSFRIWR